MSTNQSRNANHTLKKTLHPIRFQKSQTFPLRALLASPLESGPDETVVGPHAVRGVHNQGHGCLTPTLQSDTGSYLTALPCSVCLRHSPAPFPHSTTHTKTHAWSPPPPLLSLLGEREREKQRAQRRGHQQSFTRLDRVNLDRWRFRAGFVFSHPSLSRIRLFYLRQEQSALDSPGDDITHHQPIQSLGSHGQKGHVYYTDVLSTKLLSLPKTARFSHFLICCTLQCNACKIGRLKLFIAFYRLLKLKNVIKKSILEITKIKYIKKILYLTLYQLVVKAVFQSFQLNVLK